MMLGPDTTVNDLTGSSSLGWEELLAFAVDTARRLAPYGRTASETADRFAARAEDHDSIRSSAAAPPDFGTDRAEVKASLAGDPQAYARLVERHQETIAAYMWRFTRDRSTWEEMVQDVFVEAYFSLATYREQAPFAHWLKRIATRVGYRFWRRQRRRRETHAATATIDTIRADNGAAMSAVDAADLVHHLLGQLSPPSRLVMTLYYMEQLSIAEIARLTRWSESRVKVTMFRARRHLRKVCERLEIDL